MELKAGIALLERLLEDEVNLPAENFSREKTALLTDIEHEAERECSRTSASKRVVGLVLFGEYDDFIFIQKNGPKEKRKGLFRLSRVA